MVAEVMTVAEMLFRREEKRGLLERRSPKDGPIHRGGRDAVWHVNNTEIKTLMSERPLACRAAPSL